MTGRSARQKLPTTEPNLQDQVQTLTSELDRLKAIITQHGLAHVLTEERIPHQGNVKNPVTPSPSPIASNVEIVTPGTPRRKGCSCRGNCSTRICGCVKKQIPCAEFCRCADEQCQNQEPDKENIGDPENQAELSQEGQENLRKLARLSIKDTKEPKEGKSRKSNDRVENVKKTRGLFSPLSTTTGSNANIPEPITELLRFGNDSNSETSDKNEDEVFENCADPENSKVKKATKMPGRSRRQNLAPVKPQEKSRSSSSREPDDESTTQAKKVRNKRSTSLGGSGDGKVSKETHPKTLAGLINGKKPLRKGAAAKLGEASSIDHGNIEDQELNNEKVEERNKKAKKTEKGKSKTRANKNPKPTDDERAEVADLLQEAANNIQLAVQEEMQIEPQSEKTTTDTLENYETEAEKQSNENILTDDVKIEKQDDFVHVEGISENNKRSLSSNSFSSDQSQAGDSSPSYDSGSQSHLLSIDDPNFDPMKPRHKLSRSPLGLHLRPQTFLDVSERPLAPPVEEAAEELPPPDELNCVIVDWDKHQKERVYCSKCKRGFYPYRIKKHEASCKKV